MGLVREGRPAFVPASMVSTGLAVRTALFGTGTAGKEAIMTDPKCVCPGDDEYRCIRGIVYGPCSSDACGGVCTSEGACTCPVHHREMESSP